MTEARPPVSEDPSQDALCGMPDGAVVEASQWGQPEVKARVAPSARVDDCACHKRVKGITRRVAPSPDEINRRLTRNV